MGIWNRQYMRGGASRLLPPGWGAVHMIIAINVVIFIAWQLARSGSAHGLFESQFRTGTMALVRGHVWTLLTAAFSHNDLFHLFINMFIFFSFGLTVENEMRAKRFWIFYLAAAVFASLTHCALGFLLPNQNAWMLGASGAISAVIAYYALCHPDRKILLFFVIPVPALALVAIAVGIDLWGLVGQSIGSESRIGHGAHLGGSVFGLGYWYLVLRRGIGFPSLPKRGRRRRRKQRRPSRMESEEMDRILSKIQERGIDKLPMSEREFLEEISRKYREEE